MWWKHRSRDIKNSWGFEWYKRGLEKAEFIQHEKMVKRAWLIVAALFLIGIIFAILWNLL